MTHGQIEDQEQMTEQWTEEEMKKTDECIELEQEITTECFEKQEMTDEWMEEEMTMRSTFQLVIQNILHESMANLVLTAAATSPVLSFEAGENRRYCSAHLERGCGSRDEGHQNGTCERAATANRILALATAEMYSFIRAQKTIRATNNCSYFFSAPCGSKIQIAQLNF